ncbi:MAG: helix-turn-helix transcriptional regulator [Gemmatimonadota bacterium]|jgi:DNA-binding PadR family transcriptional regulator
MPQTPRLSHLQFLVVGTLLGGGLSGRQIRKRLQDFAVRKSGPAFYQLMARLEDAGLVEGTYHQEIVEGQIIRERHYTITADGSRAWKASRDFYLRAIEGFGGAEGLAGAR